MNHILKNKSTAIPILDLLLTFASDFSCHQLHLTQRKVRMAVGNQGKSGSVRVIYFLAHAEKIHLILAYPKNVKDTLSRGEKAELKKLVKLLKGESK